MTAPDLPSEKTDSKPRRKKSKHGIPAKYLHEIVMPYRGNLCLPWPFARTKAGYAQIRHEGKATYVCRLVCEEENGPPPSPDHEAAHSCGKGQEGCCAREHLIWKTRSGNQADRIEHGTHNRGTKHGMAKLTENRVRRIRSLRGEMNRSAIARMFGIHEDYVTAIQNRRAWAWLD